MTDPVDLDRLDALHAAANGVLDSSSHELLACVVALHNAWPAISAELRRLREKLAESERDAEAFHAAYQNEAHRCAAAEAELAEARAGRMTVDLTNLPKHRSSWFSDATGLGEKQGDDDGN